MRRTSMSQRRYDYPVGYGKPPRHTRFRTGQSGNPRGRPRGSESVDRLVQRIFGARIIVTENGKRRHITKLEAALTQLINKAATGDHRAIRDVLALRPRYADDAEKLVVQIVRFGDADPTAASNE